MFKDQIMMGITFIMKLSYLPHTYVPLELRLNNKAFYDP